MKKLFMVLAVLGFITVSAQYVIAQSGTQTATEQNEGEPLNQYIKTKFIEGGAGFMGTLLFLTILGLAIAIERILYLSLAAVNSKKLLSKVEEALTGEGGIEAAKEVCRNTRGPIASIFYQALSRMNQGMETVEKTIVSYGAVQTTLLEKGLSWIQLFIAVLPMIGFLGTVIGMVIAFDDIQRAGDISPTVVAGGMKFALLTTIAGLIGAVILQFFYNYILSKLDSLVMDMEDSSVEMVDILMKYKK